MGDDSGSFIKEHCFQPTVGGCYTFIQSNIRTALEFCSAPSLFLRGIFFDVLHLDIFFDVLFKNSD